MKLNNMASEFASKEWVNQLQSELNSSNVYKDAARNWEGDLCFIIKNEEKEDIKIVYLDLWHGECKNAFVSNTPVESLFTITGPINIWRKMIEGKLDPMTTLLTGKLRLKGPMARIMKSPRAAGEIVNCAKTIKTKWNIS